MVNVLDIIWVLCIAPVWITYLLVTRRPEKVSDVLVSAFFYGKLSTDNKKASRFEDIAIPKRWFRHFYQYSVILFGFWTLIFLWTAITGSGAVTHLLEVSMDLLIHDRAITVPFSVALWVQILTYLQVLRRCYECMFVSVYSESAKMHIWHYAMGFMFYTGVQYSILSMTFPADPEELSRQQLSFSLNDLLVPRVAVGTAMWAVSFWLEYDTAKRLAGLRKDKEGKVFSSKHSQPSGGMFELVSSPHYFAEIMIYTSLTVVLGCFNLTWFLGVLWTYVNQIAVALLTHSWYKKTFKNYPPSRKAIIPFLI